MTDPERQMLIDIHDFLMRPTAPGKPSRAQMLDDLIDAVAAGKLTARALLWAAGALAAIGTIATWLKIGRLP